MFYKLLILFLFPFSLFAQTTFRSDTPFEKIVETDCDGKEFTKTEVLPSLKISTAAFADSLMHYLQSKNAVIKHSLVSFRFFLTTHSQLLKLNFGKDILSPDKLVLRDAIVHFSDLWKPAVQNSRIVCSYVTLLLEFGADNIDVVILQ